MNQNHLKNSNSGLKCQSTVCQNLLWGDHVHRKNKPMNYVKLTLLLHVVALFGSYSAQTLYVLLCELYRLPAMVSFITSLFLLYVLVSLVFFYCYEL